MIELLTVNLGSAVAKATLKIWLKDKDLARESSLGLVDVITKAIPDVLSRRRTQRQFEQMAEEIAQTLLPFFEQETSHLSESEQTAAILAASRVFERANLDSSILLGQNLEPIALERDLNKAFPKQTRDLSAAGAALYQRLLRECCNYVVEIATTLPDFTLKATRELLKRESEIIELSKHVLEQLPKATSANTQDADAIFYDQYRRSESFARNKDDVKRQIS